MERNRNKHHMLKIAAGAAVWMGAVLPFGAPVADAASSYTGEVTASSLYVRTGPSTKNKALGSLKKGSRVNVTSYNSQWVKLTYKGKIAYASKQYVKQVKSSPAPVKQTVVSPKGKVTASTLNIRSTYSTKGKVVGKLKRNEIVTIAKEYKGWYYVQAGTRKGWVLGSYVAKQTPPKPAPKPAVKPVAKPVPQQQPVTKPAPTLAPAPQPVTKPAPTPAAKAVAENYQYMDIRYPSKVTAAEINSYIQKYEAYTGRTSVFHNQGDLFIRVGTEAGINQLILAAMAIHESAYGTNDLSRWKFNLFSVAAYDSSPYDSAYHFTGVEQAVRYQAYFLKSGYLNPSNWKFKGYHLGDKTAGLNFYYASDPAWGEKIANHANKIRPFRAEEYTNISIMNKVAQPVSISNSVDRFSETTRAIAKSQLSLYDRMGGSKIGTIPVDARFAVLEKYNTHYFKVEYNGQVGYVSFSFSQYANYIQIQNLVRTIKDRVNVYDDEGAVVTTLPNFTYVEQVLEDGKTVEANYRTKVKVAGKERWISIWDKQNVYR